MMLRVATWNIREGIDEDAERPFDPTSIIGPLGIDILALQEVPMLGDGRSEIVRQVTSMTGLAHSATMPLYQAIFHPTRAGIATLSRFPLGGETGSRFDAGDLSISIDGGQESVHRKGTLAVMAGVSSTRLVKVVNGHLFPFHRLGTPAESPRFDTLWASLATQLEEFRYRAAVFCGDFNTANRGLLLADKESFLSRAVGDKITHDGFASDDILASPHFEIIETRLLDTPSDHLLCMTDLLWLPEIRSTIPPES